MNEAKKCFCPCWESNPNSPLVQPAAWPLYWNNVLYMGIYYTFMKITVFWQVTPYNLVDFHLCITAICSCHLQGRSSLLWNLKSCIQIFIWSMIYVNVYIFNFPAIHSTISTIILSSIKSTMNLHGWLLINNVFFILFIHVATDANKTTKPWYTKPSWNTDSLLSHFFLWNI